MNYEVNLANTLCLNLNTEYVYVGMIFTFLSSDSRITRVVSNNEITKLLFENKQKEKTSVDSSANTSSQNYINRPIYKYLPMNEIKLALTNIWPTNIMPIVKLSFVQCTIQYNSIHPSIKV